MMKRFVFTEKCIRLIYPYNKYVLDVDTYITKLQIKLIVEKLFSVKVQYVNRYRSRRVNRKSIGSIKTHKRAIVTLAEGEKIKLY
jgi:ribosomal protein L23